MALDLTLEDIYIHPGESRLVANPAIIRTILGSCVGITFWNARLGVGALCHPMLPGLPLGGADGLGLAAGLRYVDFTIRNMAQQLDSRGALRHEVEVKLFGGADVLPVHEHSNRPTVGRLNRESALRVLSNEGFQVMASSLGGCCGITIQFNTATGEVRLRRLPSTKVEAKSTQ